MSKLLIVEDSVIVRGLLKNILDEIVEFEYDLVATYKEAKKLLTSKRYEFAVTARILKDAPNGEIIPLFNKHNIAPIVFTNYIDEDFFENFESSNIVDYIKKSENYNILDVVQRLKQLHINKTTTALVFSESKIYQQYLKQNLNIHSFKVFTSFTYEEAYSKLDLHPEISLFIIDTNQSHEKTLKLIEYVKSIDKINKMKIIVLVDEANLYQTSELLKFGADDYIVKQFSRDEFYIRVYQNINKVC